MVLTHVVHFRFLAGASLSADAPAAPATFNNSTMNWLSPSMHICIPLALFLYLRLSP